MIRVRKEDGVWQVVIDRQDKANSLTADMLQELAKTAEAAAGKARVFSITGAGKVFSAGADLEEARAGLATDPVWERASGAIAALPCLSVCAINGTLAGGAFGMALACDMRIAVPGARFFYPVMRLGFLPQPSDPPRLARLVGPARAKLILMGGARITADEALAFGLVDRVVDSESLSAAIADLTADARDATPEHVAAIKAMIPG